MSVTQGLYQFGGGLYAAWKGETGDDRLFYAWSDSTNWHQQKDHIPGNSSIGPSLASPNPDALYAIWKGEVDNDLRIFYSSFDGTAWAPQTQIPKVTSSGADNQLTAVRAVPADAEVRNPTAEISNSAYTAIAAGVAGTLVQRFGVTG